MEEQIEQKSFLKSVINTFIGALRYIGLSIAFAIIFVGFNSFLFDKPITLGGFVLAWIVAFIIVLRQ